MLKLCRYLLMAAIDSLTYPIADSTSKDKIAMFKIAKHTTVLNQRAQRVGLEA